MWDPATTKSELFIHKDTYYNKDTYKAATDALTTTLCATNVLLDGPEKYSFAVVRPPGHHSGMKSQPHGFSFFNNVAFAA